MKVSAIRLRSALRSRLAQRGDDRGVALVTVIGAMMVMAIVVTIVVAATSSTVRTTTVTRSDVQSKAAAEAGVDYVRSVIAEGTCSAPGGTVTSPAGLPEFSAKIFWSASGTASESSTPGCPTAAATSILVRSTGTADAAGIGDSRNNQNTVEALLLPQAAASPAFNAAIFSGQDMNVSTNLDLRGDGADIVTNGSYRCASKQSISGSIYADGKVTFSSGPCKIDGDVYGSAFECSNASNVGGGLYIQGKGNFSTQYCSFGKDVWIGGDANAARGIKTSGNLVVRGNIPVNNAASELPVVDKSVTAGGLIGGGSGSAYNLMRTKYPGMLQNQAVALPPKAGDVVTVDFPKLTPASPEFAGFVKKSWKGAVQPLIRSGMSACDQGWGSNEFKGKLKVSVPTMFDTSGSSECNGKLKLGAHFELDLNADAVIFAENFEVNGHVKISASDGGNHSLYIVGPYPASQKDCSTTANGRIQFVSGKWTQDPSTSVLLYTPGQITFTMSPELRGQIYSCKVEMNTSVDFTFSKTGASSSTPSAANHTVAYIRDLS